MMDPEDVWALIIRSWGISICLHWGTTNTYMLHVMHNCKMSNGRGQVYSTMGFSGLIYVVSQLELIRREMPGNCIWWRLHMFGWLGGKSMPTFLSLSLSLRCEVTHQRKALHVRLDMTVFFDNVCRYHFVKPTILPISWNHRFVLLT